MAVINTNYLALVSQNNLNKSQSSLGQAIERLSSGSRINSAKDDAAGQAIANRFTANIKGLTQAARNANDGISLSQTTEGALNEINDNIQRIRELTVDAANGTKSSSDLQSIQDEIDERVAEIDRISEQTQFNGIKVLGEDAGLRSIQVGANDNQVINIETQETNTSKLGLDKLNVIEAYDGEIRSAGTKIDKDFGTGDVLVAAGATAGVLAGETVTSVGIAKDGAAYATFETAGGNTVNYVKLKASASGSQMVADGGASTTKPAGFEGGDDATLKDVKIDTSGLAPASGDDAQGGQISLVKDNNGNYYAKVTGATNPDGDGYYEVEIGLDGKASLTTGGSWNVAGQADMPENSPTGVNVNPLDGLDKAIAQIDSQRSMLGAIQNRFESTINNLNNTISNLSSARSRIEDADYAVEVSSMTRAQILQQAGTSVLAQANQIPQSMLSLLG